VFVRACVRVRAAEIRRNILSPSSVYKALVRLKHGLSLCRIGTFLRYLREEKLSVADTQMFALKRLGH